MAGRRSLAFASSSSFASIIKPRSATTPSTALAPTLCRPCLRIQQQCQQQQQQQQQQRRELHRHVKPLPIPSPTPFVPDVQTFLTLIGRGLSAHATKIESWNALFQLSSTQLKDLGINPPRSRRYLLRWRQKFRKGEFGVGGDLKYVQDGIGELRVVEVPSLPRENTSATATENTDGAAVEAVSASRSPGMTKLILNVPNGSTTYNLERGQTTADLKKPKELTLKDGHIIVGPYVQPMKQTNGSGAILKVVEGMWEHRRGHKVFGGERRRAETLHKMRVAERKKNAR